MLALSTLTIAGKRYVRTLVTISIYSNKSENSFPEWQKSLVIELALDFEMYRSRQESTLFIP
jgi:hypothetical protein